MAASKPRARYLEHRKAATAAATFALLGAAMTAAPAFADDVAPGRNLEVNHSIEMGVLENYPDGQRVRVDVLRGGTRIATKTIEGSNPGTVDINHVGGDDCWEGVTPGTTPDVRPGDQLVATVLNGLGGDTGDVDHMFVRDIAFDENPTTGRITGHARGVASGGVFDPAPQVDLATGIMEAKRVDRPNETVDYAFTAADFDGNGNFTNVDVGGRPGEGELFIDFIDESGGGSGTTTTFRSSEPPETPCGAIATTAFTSNSHEVINQTNVGQPMVVGGPRREGVTVTFAFNGQAYDVTAGPGTWQATVPAADLAALPDGGQFQAVATFSDSPALPETKTILKDVTAPVLNASVAPGTYDSPVSVALSSNGSEDVRYTLDGSEPRSTSRLYDGVAIGLGFGSHTIRAFAVDQAGNRTDEAFSYTIREAASQPAPGGASGAGAAGAGSVATTERNRLVVRTQRRRLVVLGLRMRSVLRRSSVRRSGISARLRLERGTRVVEARIYRGRRLVARVVRRVGSRRTHTLRLNTRAVRRLGAGRYRLRIRAGRTQRRLGASSIRYFRIR